MSKIISITCILGMYSLAVLSIYGYLQHAPVGSFWHIPFDSTAIVCLGAVSTHIFMYLDECFGLRKGN